VGENSKSVWSRSSASLKNTKGRTDRLHPKTVSNEEGLPVIVALKCQVRKAADPPSEFSHWQFVFLCSAELRPAGGASSHTAKRIQCVLMYGSPIANTTKILYFCHRLTTPVLDQEVDPSAGTVGYLTQ